MKKEIQKGVQPSQPEGSVNDKKNIVMENKYSWDKVEENKYYIWHFEPETQTLIAITDTAEKAHFLATAANKYWPSPKAVQSKEEILDNHTKLFSVKYPKYLEDAVLKAMEEYAAQTASTEVELLNETIKNQHKLILSGEERGYQKAKEEFQTASPVSEDELSRMAEDWYHTSEGFDKMDAFKAGYRAKKLSGK